MGTTARTMNIQGMISDDVVIVMSAFNREGEGVTADLWCEYETFWVEEGRVCWKLYDIHGPIIVKMKIAILMESMLGDATIMARFFSVKE